MKNIKAYLLPKIVLIVTSLFLFSCSENEGKVVHQETGIVINFAGADHCSYVIELDNGQKILPLYYPEEFEFVNGQRVLLSYSELPNVVSTCGKGTVSEVLQIEEISCGFPLKEYEEETFYGMVNDPVILNGISVEGDCLMLNVSYSGGCRQHVFELAKLTDAEQEEGVAVVVLRHDAKGDACEAALTTDVSFDISGLREEGYTHI